MYNKLKNIIPNRIKIDNFSARLLSSNDLPIIQTFLDNNEDFFIMSTGEKARKNEAEEILKNIPGEKVNENKFLIGLLDDNELVAFVDIIQNYKNDAEWTINYFLVNKNYRGKAIATRLLNAIENILLSLKVNTLRVVVQEQNVCGSALWNKTGFKEIERIKQKIFSDKNDIVMTKKLERKEPTIEEKYFKNGKLVNFSSKPLEQKEIYKIMQNWFEKGKKYSEMEINNIIKSKIECKDHVTLRRDMVDNGFLNRSSDGKEYWV